MKVLVVIANHGTKNFHHVTKVLDEYRRMKFTLRIVVLSNVSKDLGPDVEVLVGTPTRDPRSLPFGYKKIFAENKGRYDLYVYTEDDILIQQKHLEAFLNLSRQLEPAEVPGFVRYELSPEGRKFYSSFHSHFHWETGSVRRVGDYTLARFTNEHSGCVLLTRNQLEQALRFQEGFLRPPREGRYGILETAATDPYTQCGLKRWICVSHFESFALHHLPNVYLGKMGVAEPLLKAQLSVLSQINGNSSSLLCTRTELEHPVWDKRFYEPVRKDLLSAVAPAPKRVLSIGCGDGATEAAMIAEGHEVTAIPLDEVIAASARERGVRVLHSDYAKAISWLGDSLFDVVLFPDILHLEADPVGRIKQFIPFLDKGGEIVASVPNCSHRWLLGRLLRGDPQLWKLWILRRYDMFGVQFTTHRVLRSWLLRTGLRVTGIFHAPDREYAALSRRTHGLMDRWLAWRIVAKGRLEREL